jgi:hypothetical protein
MGKIKMSKDHSRSIKTELKCQKKLLQEEDMVRAPFTISEFDIALSKTKIN